MSNIIRCLVKAFIAIFLLPAICCAYNFEYVEMNPFTGNWDATRNLESIDTDLLPSADDTYDLGSPPFQWQDLYLSGNVTLSQFTEGYIPYFGSGGLLTENMCFQLDEGSCTLDVQQIESLKIVTAKAGENISIGKCVYILSVTGDKPEVFLADNTLHDKAHDLGFALETKTTGQSIDIGVAGEFINVDTSAYSTGRLHLITNGDVQNAVASNGAHIHMGWATKIDSTEGIIFIKPVDYFHDIRGTSDLDILLACGSDDATRKGIFENWSGNDLGYWDGAGDWNWDSNTFYVDASINSIGRGTNTPDTFFQLEENIDNSASVDDPLSTLGTSPIMEIQNPNATIDSWAAYTLGHRGSANDKWFIQSIYRGAGESKLRIGYDQAGAEVYKPVFTIDGSSGQSIAGFLGEEKITNGDMSSATGWTVGTSWAIAGGVATRSTGVQGNLSQSSANMATPLVVGETYLVSFDIDSVDTAQFTRLTCGGADILFSLNETGYSSAIFIATTTDDLKFDPQNNNTAITIDDVSLKKIIRKDLIAGNWFGVGVEPQYPLHINAEAETIGIMMEGTSQTTPSFAMRSNPSTSVGSNTFSFNYDGSNQWVHFKNTAFKLDDAQRILFGAASQGYLQYDSSLGFFCVWNSKPIFITTKQYVDLGIDSVPTVWGASDDGYLAYSGGDMVMNPQDTGTGGFGVAGDLFLGDYSSLGGELVTNGDDFSSGWTTTGWTITGGTAVHNTGNTNALSQSIGSLTTNKLYKVTYEIESNPGFNGLTVAWGGFSKIHTTSDLRVFEMIVRATATSHTITFTPTTNSTVTIDDVSITELSDADLYAGIGNFDSLNTTEFQVEADGDTFWVGAGSGLSYGEIYTDDNSTTSDLAAQDTWYDVTIFDADGQENNADADHTDDSITIQKAGIYLITVSLDLRSAASNSYYFAVFKNKVAGTELSNLESRRSTTVANKPGSVSISGLASLVATDTISLGVKRTDGGAVSKSVLLEHANISIVQIGG